MTFLAPWALAVAGVMAAGLVALHLLARQRPRAAFLPTARFVPDRPAHASERAVRLTDLALLALRVTAVLLVGAAFARPVPVPGHRAVARIVVVDRSASARDPGEGLDSAARLIRAGDVLVLFDSTARAVAGAVRDSLEGARTAPASHAPGSLSAALAAALRAAAPLRLGADSAELVLVSPFAREEWDDATGAIRAAWSGRARLVHLAPAAPDGHASSGADAGVDAGADAGVDAGARRIEVLRATRGDPVRATVALLGAQGGAGAGDGTGVRVRIDRGAPETADVAWARGRGHVLLRWPATLAATADAAPPSGGAARDTVGAVVAGPAVLVAPFAREAAPPPPPGRVVARWVDGAPAATERSLGAGCVRDVAIAIPVAGDLALRDGARALVRALVRPCGPARDARPMPDSMLAVLRGPPRLLATDALPERPARPSRLAAWLLAAALALLLAEPLLRRPRREEAP